MPPLVSEAFSPLKEVDRDNQVCVESSGANGDCCDEVETMRG